MNNPHASKIMVRHILLVVGMALLSFTSFGAVTIGLDPESLPPGDFDTWLAGISSNLSLASSVVDKSQQNNPANFGTDSSGNLATDVGAKYIFSLKDDWNIDPLFEYHKEISTKTPEDSVLAGIDVTKMENISETYFFFDNNVQFKNDRVKSGKALDESLGATFVSGDLRFNANHYTDPIPGNWAVWLYVQGENGDRLKATDKHGNVGRFELPVSVTLYPLYNVYGIGSRVQLTAAEGIWYNFARSGTYDKYNQDQSDLSTKLSLFLDKKKKFGFYVGYDNGENPSTGQNKDRAWSFGVQGSFLKNGSPGS
jgi:hypothetical protein